MEINETIKYCMECGGIVYHSHFDENLITLKTDINWCKCSKESRQNLVGWECPRCHKIHSPYSISCDCPPHFIINYCNTTCDDKLKEFEKWQK